LLYCAQGQASCQLVICWKHFSLSGFVGSKHEVAEKFVSNLNTEMM
jgi:hypothetical protein